MSLVPQIYKVAASAFITIVTTTMAATVLMHSIIVMSPTRVDKDNSMLHTRHSDHVDNKRGICV